MKQDEDETFIKFKPRKLPIVENKTSVKEVVEERIEEHCPWIKKDTENCKHPLIRLQNEILDFCEYIELTEAEIAEREKAIRIIAGHVKELWPDFEVKPFGSFVTGLSLPDSDVDIVIITNSTISPRQVIKKLSQNLKDKGALLECEEILGAKIPILKVVEKETAIHLDISFNSFDGCKSIKVIKSALKEYPQLKYILLPVKAFLRERGLNETYKGGISSFLLILIIISFIQYQTKLLNVNLTDVPISELLIEFFRFYGCKFNNEELGMSILGKGSLYKRPSKDKGISVENPLDPNIDLGGSIRRYNDVLKAFQFASEMLRYTSCSLKDIIHCYSKRTY